VSLRGSRRRWRDPELPGGRCLTHIWQRRERHDPHQLPRRTSTRDFDHGVGSAQARPRLPRPAASLLQCRSLPLGRLRSGRGGGGLWSVATRPRGSRRAGIGRQARGPRGRQCCAHSPPAARCLQEAAVPFSPSSTIATWVGFSRRRADIAMILVQPPISRFPPAMTM
jgi:hypothetical protein